MAKAKGGAKKAPKRGLADKIGLRKGTKKAADPLSNPFEIRVNKQKHIVLGRLKRNEKGLPGVARSKAIKKREATLLQEYKVRHKNNVFKDKRIGEKGHAMSPEEKMFARFAAEKIRHHEKKSIYNLADDEVLTHKGQTLSEIEKFDDPRSDDEDDDRLEDEFVQEAHFGGFMTKKKEGEEGGASGKGKSRKELIEELIAESKKKKAERQKEKEETEDLTSKLDAAWKTMASVVGFNKEKKDELWERRNDPYDVVVRELKFEGRAKATDRLKSEEEIARDEKERLEELEKERLRRMRGEFDEPKKPKHRSADDINDGLDLDDTEDATIAYKDGKILGMDKDEDEVVGNGEAESEDDGGEDEDDDGRETGDDSGEEEDDSGEDNDEDDYSDVKEDSESELEEELELEEERKEEMKAKLLKRKEIMEGARKEIAYVFEVPESYEDLLHLLEPHVAKDQGMILERMIKCNHPSLGVRNKAKLEHLFAYLLQYIHDCASDCEVTETLEVIEEVVPHLYDLASISPKNNSACFRDVLQEKYQEFCKRGERRYAGLEVLIFLKIATVLYPSSDFQHPIITPVMMFVTQLLGQKLMSSRKHIAVGLFLCSIVVESIQESKRYLPEVVNFLKGVISLGVPKAPPFRHVGPIKQLLVLSEGGKSIFSVETHLSLSELWTRKEVDDKFRVSAMQTALKLTSELICLWKLLPSWKDIFGPLWQELTMLPKNKCSLESQRLAEEILLAHVSGDDSETTRLQPLVEERKKPKPLRLYEPRFDDKFDGRKKRVGSKEKLEQEKLLHNYKREMKSAVREIRRDNAFLAQEQFKEAVQRDSERKRKVKELMASLSMQEGEFRQLKRLKES